MPFDPSRADLVIQYALLVAGEQDDPFERQLGPIHLIKYVYLADLAFASRNSGESFTGAPWKFHKFGPWSNAVNERIAPALSSIGADQRRFESDYEDKNDWIRWSLRNDDILRGKERALPAAVTLRLRPYIRRFGKDTPSLLDYVYKTPPMLVAAPGESLDLVLVAQDPTLKAAPATRLRYEELTERKRKRFKQRVKALQDIVSAKTERAEKLINPVKNARIDHVYEEGISWLDELAGEKLEPGEKRVEFSDEVWNSETRKGDDVS